MKQGAGFKILIGIGVFVAGFAIMALEILGSRLLAPTFGSSIFVWGSLIGVFLISMAAGYFFGGRISLKSPSLGVLTLLAVGAALFILFIPSISKPVCQGIDGVFNSERWGSLFSTIILFSFPLCLLGGISPYAIRLLSRTVETVGDTAGNLYAISTVGSFLGTIITAFYLIPFFPTSQTVRALGIGLALIFLILYAAGAAGGFKKSD